MQQDKVALSQNRDERFAVSKCEWLLAYLVFVAAMVVAVLFRVLNLGEPGFYNPDGAAYLWQSTHLEYLSNYSKPAHILMVTLPVRLLGVFPWVIKAHSAFWGILTIGIVFLMGRKYFGIWAGVVAGAYIGLLPLHIYLSRTGFAHTDSTAFLLFAFIAYIAARGSLASREGYRLLLLTTSGICAAWAFLAHPSIAYFAAVFLVLEIYTWICQRRRWRKLILETLVFGMSAILVVCLMDMILRSFGKGYFEELFIHIRIEPWLTRTDPLYFIKAPFLELHPIGGILLPAAIVLTVIRLFAKGNKQRFLDVALLSAIIIPIVLLNLAGRSGVIHRLLIPVFPFAGLLLGRWVQLFREWTRTSNIRWQRVCAAMACLVFFGGTLYAVTEWQQNVYNLRVKWRSPYRNLRDFLEDRGEERVAVYIAPGSHMREREQYQLLGGDFTHVDSNIENRPDEVNLRRLVRVENRDDLQRAAEDGVKYLCVFRHRTFQSNVFIIENIFGTSSADVLPMLVVRRILIYRIEHVLYGQPHDKPVYEASFEQAEAAQNWQQGWSLSQYPEGGKEADVIRPSQRDGVWGLDYIRSQREMRSRLIAGHEPYRSAPENPSVKLSGVPGQLYRVEIRAASTEGSEAIVHLDAYDEDGNRHYTPWNIEEIEPQVITHARLWLPPEGYTKGKVGISASGQGRVRIENFTLYELPPDR